MRVVEIASLIYLPTGSACPEALLQIAQAAFVSAFPASQQACTQWLSLQGAAAYKAKVNFPEDKELLARTVIVGEMNPAVNLEQVSRIHAPL